jgi:hypothetical protein
MGFFTIGSLTFSLGWLQTVIVLIFAFLVARIAGINYWCQSSFLVAQLGKVAIYSKDIDY